MIPDKIGPKDFEPYLTIQNSWGKEVGAGGLYYFPREVVNREWTFGAIMFKDLPLTQAKYLQKKGLGINALWRARIATLFNNLFCKTS